MNDPAAFRLLNEIGIIAQLSRTMFERLMPAGLTLSQFTVLNHFARLGGEKSPADLARAFQVTRGTMTSTLQKLEEKGFVDLSPDPRDGRGKRVRLTGTGRQARDAAIAALGPWIADLERQLDSAALAASLPFLTALRTHLDQARDAEERVTA